MDKGLKAFANEHFTSLQDNITTQKDHLATSIKHFEDRMGQNQQDTLWKIRDYEDLLKTRISEEKVNVITTAIETKLNLDVKHLEERFLDKLGINFDENE